MGTGVCANVGVATTTVLVADGGKVALPSVTVAAGIVGLEEHPTMIIRSHKIKQKRLILHLFTIIYTSSLQTMLAQLMQPVTARVVPSFERKLPNAQGNPELS